MQRCLAIAWLLWTMASPLVAEDLTRDPFRGSKLPQVFRSGRPRFLAVPESESKSTFDLKASISSSPDFLNVPASLDDEESEIDELESAKNARRSPGVLRVQHTEQMEPNFGEPSDNLLPPGPSSSVSITLNNELFDGALPDANASTKDDVERTVFGTYSSIGWIAGANDRLGILELDYKPSSRVWYDPTQTNKFYFGTNWGAKWLTGPNITDLPPQLFNVSIDVGTRLEIDDRMIIDAMICPGWYTDFSNKGVQAFRLPWHLVSYYQVDSDWHWAMGVTDLGRDDIRYLPVLGPVYAPGDGNVRLDLVFPKPRVAWKIREGTESTRQFYSGKISIKTIPLWLTLGGELGGGSYAISRADRAYDVVTYRDYRLVAGLESKENDGPVSRLEAGWIFNRAVEYRSGLGNYSPTDTFMIRVSSDY